MTYQMSTRHLLLFKKGFIFQNKMQLKDVWYFNNETLMFAVIEKDFIS